MPSRSASAAATSKRHSLNVTMGPRPLHLVDGDVPFSITSPTTTSNPVFTQLPSPPPSTNTSNSFAKPNVRRHSSISYRSSDEIINPPRSALSGPQSSLIPSPSIVSSSYSPEGDQGGAHERSPLTLAEKHSDLLHFIAQKESKCLELRCQLTILEAEILQLKRKWERIVNRGFVDNSPASASTSQGSGAVFGGIVEGVQGVGRFLAAGLAIGDQTPPSRPLSSASRSQRPTHSYSRSNSPSAAYATKSTRLSRSPASSIAQDTASASAANERAGDSESAQILMVYDTGATPTMSPNPAFERQRQRQQQQGPTDLQPYLESPPLNTGSKLHRRKSRDVHSRSPVPCEEPSTSSSQSSEATEARKEAIRAKRATIHGTSFPPVSSIPGLAALTVGPASPVSSLVGSVGKKWEELQRGSSFSKNQKRASLLLSDVSQSIVSALSSPSTLMSPAPSYFDPSTPSAEYKSPINRTTGTSLKNDNILASPRTTLTPSVATQLKPCPDPVWQLLEPTSPPRAIPVVEKQRKPDHEDEWNW